MKRIGDKFTSLALPPTVLAIAILAFVEAYVRLAHVSSYMMVPPSAIAGAMVRSQTHLYSALGWTAAAVLSGFALSAITGILFAVAMSAFPLVRRAVYPYTIIFQTIPIAAIAPILVLGLGFGLLPVTACVIIVSIFPVIVNTLSGLLSADPALIDLFRLYGAGAPATMWKLRLPTALPAIFSGLRVASGLSVIGAIVAEILVGETVGHVGLGVKIKESASNSHLDVALAAVILASTLGLAMFGLVNAAAWFSLRRWHASGRQD